MSVTSEHLLDDTLDVLVEVGWEIRGFANPVLVGAGEGGHGLVEVRRWCTDRRVGGDAGAARGVCCLLDILGRVGGKDVRVVDFADNPSLDSDYVRRGGNLGWPAVFEPGVCESVPIIRLERGHVVHS